MSTPDFDEISNLRPNGVDPDAGWVCFARVGDQVVISFDFRRHRRRARARLGVARSFHESARLDFVAGLHAPAIENLFAAAELTVWRR